MHLNIDSLLVLEDETGKLIRVYAKILVIGNVVMNCWHTMSYYYIYYLLPVSVSRKTSL